MVFVITSLLVVSTSALSSDGAEEARRCAEIEYALASPYAISPESEMRSAAPRDAFEDMRARVLSQPDRTSRNQLRNFYDRIECSRFASDADV
jgi:hypothetical protein